MVEQALIEHDIQYQVATLEREFRRAQRVVARRPLDHAHQQGQVLRFEAIHGAPEQHAAGTRKTVNRNTILL